MKTRNERRLIELAFGDLPAEAEAQVAADPAAKERLAEYRQMKAALSQLREVPDHQLSTERMRQAILNRGVARRRRFVWERVGYAAAACAIFFVAFGLARHLRTSGSPVINIPDTANVADVSSSAFGVFNPMFTPTFETKAKRAIHHTARQESAPDEVTESHRNSTELAIFVPPSKSDHKAPKGVKKIHKPVVSPAASPDSLADNDPSQDNGVLVIEDASDTSTGLSNAKEVASKSAAVGG